MRNRLLGNEAVPNPTCCAVRAHLRIFPNGNVPVCQFNSHALGNVRSQPFDAVWFGSRAKTARAWVRDCPGCWAECEVLPSAFYSGDIFKRLRWGPT